MKWLFVITSVLLFAACTQTGRVTSELPENIETQTGDVEGMVGNEIGQVPYDFTVTTTGGRTIKLSDIARDKPTIVYFMATWCPYCASDYRALEQVFPEYEDKINFLNIGLDLTENTDILKNYKNSKYVPGDLAPGTQQILLDYDVRSTTTKYVIKDGEIIFKNAGAMGANQWKRILDAILLA